MKKITSIKQLGRPMVEMQKLIDDILTVQEGMESEINGILENQSAGTFSPYFEGDENDLELLYIDAFNLCLKAGGNVDDIWYVKVKNPFNDVPYRHYFVGDIKKIEFILREKLLAFSEDGEE